MYLFVYYGLFEEGGKGVWWGWVTTATAQVGADKLWMRMRINLGSEPGDPVQSMFGYCHF